MPRTTVLFYKSTMGEVPVLRWLQDLRASNRRAYGKSVAVIEELGARGYELRRPIADYLQDGIYELRTRVGRENYRILYFFRGQNTAILAHALTKEAEVPLVDLERALSRKVAFEASPTEHTHEEETENG